MVSLNDMAGVTFYRTSLLTEHQAQSFARCLARNRRFSNVNLCHSARAKGAACWFVTFAPSNPDRQAVLLGAQQDARTERAAVQSFTFAANQQEAYCFSHGSGETYQIDPHGSWCGCEDF